MTANSDNGKMNLAQTKKKVKQNQKVKFFSLSLSFLLNACIYILCKDSMSKPIMGPKEELKSDLQLKYIHKLSHCYIQLV